MENEKTGNIATFATATMCLHKHSADVIVNYTTICTRFLSYFIID